MKYLAIVMSICAVLGGYVQGYAAGIETYREIFQKYLELGPATHLQLHVHGKKATVIDSKLYEIYAANNFQPYWLEGGRPSKRGVAIMAVLDDALSHGLNPKDYFIDNIHSYWDSQDPEALVRLDILLSLGMVRYVADQREGRVEPREIDPQLFASACNVEIAWKPLLDEAFTAPDMKHFLEQQAPPFVQYKLLMKKLAEYRILEALGGWPTVSFAQVLKPDMVDDGVVILRKRLSVTGEYPEGNSDSNIYDPALLKAVKVFQRRHGLQDDGVIGQKTLTAMNIPISSRINQIILNMERYRWLERNDLNVPMVVVNIAGYRAFAGKEGNFDLDMPVIVGTEYHQTPVFSDSIRYVEFNPFWTLPPSIARNETLPQLKKDRNYLKKNNMRLFQGWNDNSPELNSSSIDWKLVSPRQMNSYRIRQDPGPNNALGSLKIMFPNIHDVYLHDTPSRGLFVRDNRALSHGCIRLGQPVEMASWVLGGETTGWTIEKIKETIATKKRKVVHLTKPVPVYILYRTAVVDTADGSLHFYEDIYGRDKLLGRALSTTVD